MDWCGKSIQNYFSNNQYEIKNIHVESSKLELLHESFYYFLKSEQKYKSIIQEIKSIKLTDKIYYGLWKYINFKYMENIHHRTLK